MSANRQRRLALVQGGWPGSPTLPLYPPGRPWVSGLELDEAGTRLHMRLLNDAMAPTFPAGSWLAAQEVQAAGPLAPGVYLVRDERPGFPSYVGRLLAGNLGAEQLVFEFDGDLPEPIVCSLPRVGGAVRLYWVQALDDAPAA